MIFTEDGHVTIKGIDIEVMADAACILHGLYQTFSDKNFAVSTRRLQ